MIEECERLDSRSRLAACSQLEGLEVQHYLSDATNDNKMRQQLDNNQSLSLSMIDRTFSIVLG